MKACELLTKRCHEDRQHTELSIVRKATIYAKTANALHVDIFHVLLQMEGYRANPSYSIGSKDISLAV